MSNLRSRGCIPFYQIENYRVFHAEGVSQIDEQSLVELAVGLKTQNASDAFSYVAVAEARCKGLNTEILGFAFCAKIPSQATFHEFLQFAEYG